MAELAELRKQCMASLYSCTENVFKYLDEEQDAELASLRNCVREYCSMEARQDLEAQALAMATRDTDASNLNSLDEKFNAHLNSMLTQRRLNIDNHPFMLEFEKRITNRRSTLSQNLDESDLAITETQEAFLDPITKQPLKDPVRNAMCGHLYERVAIHSHIKNRSRAKCPVVGCANPEPIQIGHLVEDDSIRLRIATQQTATVDRSLLDLDEMDSQ